jgi:hypothetical protein
VRYPDPLLLYYRCPPLPRILSGPIISDQESLKGVTYTIDEYSGKVKMLGKAMKA